MGCRLQATLRHKTASAAFAMLALPWLCAAAESLPGERAAFDEARRAYRFQLPETPEIIGEFLANYPASNLTAEADMMLADWYFFNKEYPLALRYYSEIPDDAFSGNLRERLQYRKALSQIKTGYYDEAAAYLTRLRGSREFGSDARFYVAYIDYVNGKYDEAYRQFQQIKSGDPKGAEAEYYINQIDYRNGEYRKVANTSERLLSGGKVPDELLAESIRVGALSNFKLGDKTTARNMLSRYIGLTGDGAEISALYALGTIYYDEGNYDKALPLFGTVTEYPGDLAQSAWLYIGQIYMSRGDAQAAALAFDKAAKESWDQDVAETAAYNLAVTSTEGMGLPFADSAAAMENFIATYPSSPYASSLAQYLTNAYYARRDYEKALAQVEKIRPQNETTAAMRQRILYQMGAALLKQGDTAAAIASLTQAASSSMPDRQVGAEANLWLGDAYYARKEYARAANAYSAAIASRQLGDNTAIADYNLGYAYMKTRSYAKAETAFKDALALPGLNPGQKADARLRYADCLYYNGKYREALAIFRDIKLDGGSDAVFAQIREADILGRDGKITEKITILETLLDNPDAGVWRTTVLSRLADAYSEKGDDRKAAELYARMLDADNQNSDNTQTYYSLATNAENLYNAGDPQAAYSAYKRLEKSGIPALYPAAVTGIMRTSGDNAEIAEYAAKSASLPGISPEEMDEALFLGAQAGIALGGQHRKDALTALNNLARSSDRLWGARAAVTLGEQYLQDGDLAAAEEILLHLVDNGSDDNYWLARGYIALADVYAAQGKDYLARLYLQTLQNNYPGNEKDIRQMTTGRLKKLEQ